MLIATKKKYTLERKLMKALLVEECAKRSALDIVVLRLEKYQIWGIF
jgi:hypothetical protein